RSGLPSPLKSPTATETELLPVVKTCCDVKLGVVDPVGVVFNSTDTEACPPAPLAPLTTARSGLPSPLKSATANELGLPLASKVRWGAKLTVNDPAGVVFSSTDT